MNIKTGIRIGIQSILLGSCYTFAGLPLWQFIIVAANIGLICKIHYEEQ
jgi:hypothetical protein